MGEAAAGGGRIGPNAVTQMLAPLERRCGAEGLAGLLAAAGIAAPPPLDGLMDEAPAIRLHSAVRTALPHDAARIAREAGEGTARYVMAHRIPAPIRALLRALPAPLARATLARAIARHAWTFAGSGAFAVVSRRPLVFEIAANPLAVGPRCDWHEAVFETLFRSLADPRATVRETACCGAGAPACRFEIGR